MGRRPYLGLVKTHLGALRSMPVDVITNTAAGSAAAESEEDP
jgi:hypothetical protein